MGQRPEQFYRGQFFAVKMSQSNKYQEYFNSLNIEDSSNNTDEIAIIKQNDPGKNQGSKNNKRSKFSKRQNNEQIEDKKSEQAMLGKEHQTMKKIFRRFF